MKQADLGLNLTTKRTRKREFLAQMERVVPWFALVQLVAPFAPEGKKGRPPFSVETMLRVHFMQQWFTLSDPAMEEALHDIALFREFAGLGWDSRIPDESTILRFRHLLERKRDPEMKQSKKGNQWHFGMKAHIGVDAESGLVHTVIGTSGNVNDVVPANSLLHGEEDTVFADSGYRGAHKRPDARPNVTWHIAVRPSDRRRLKVSAKLGTILDQIEKLKASIRAKVEHPFRVIKRQFGHTKVRYRGLFKNTAQLKTLFALSNLWMARLKLMALDEQVRPMRAKTA